MSRTQMPRSLKQLPVLLMMSSFRLQKTLADYRDDPRRVKGFRALFLQAARGGEPALKLRNYYR